MSLAMQLPAAIVNKLRCWSFYFWGCYRGTLEYIAEDSSEVRLELPLSRRTRNYEGTIFGGSIYSAIDPFCMLMLMHRLGPDFIVWDKAAKIEFLKPGRETLHARFVIDDAELASIRAALDTQRSVDRSDVVELTDGKGTVCARVEKIIYIRRESTSTRS